MFVQKVIHNFITSDSYTDCLIITHPDIAVLGDGIAELRGDSDWPILDIGQELSKELLFIQPGKRSPHTRDWLNGIANKMESEPIVCANISLLFEPSLDLDPLALFRHLGRNKKLIVMWPGRYHGDVLSYAVPEHQHYRVWQKPDATIYSLE